MHQPYQQQPRSAPSPGSPPRHSRRAQHPLVCQQPAKLASRSAICARRGDAPWLLWARVRLANTYREACHVCLTDKANKEHWRCILSLQHECSRTGAHDQAQGSTCVLTAATSRALLRAVRAAEAADLILAKTSACSSTSTERLLCCTAASSSHSQKSSCENFRR